MFKPHSLVHQPHPHALTLPPVFFPPPHSGYWNVTVHGRKHSYHLYCKLLNEAVRWANAVQNVIDSKAPMETPTQQLIQDIKVIN